MELITSHIDKIEDLLMRMDDEIDTARSVPFSSKVSVEKQVLFDIIDDMKAIVTDMRKGLPHEISQARRVLGDKDNHISEARSKAEMIIKAAQAEAAKMLSENQITIQAKFAAEEIKEEANKEISDFKLSAAQYVDGVFEELNDMMQAAMSDYTTKSREIEGFYKDIMSELYNNRKRIRIDGEK
ncbi:MAG: hypothetical protein FWE34_05005 [Defluviitaleaceae bacterium]|nr:hypothetical protein [Defluviitaleaceae bacterium]